MKKRICAALLLAVIFFTFSGCSLWAVETRLDALEDAVDHRIDAAEDAVMEAIYPKPAPPREPAPPALLTREEAESIALEYAGFTAEQVRDLQTEYEIDDRVPQYDIQFREGRWEYELEVHAETGEILSFDQDS